MVATKLNLSYNVVQGGSYENFSTQFHNTKFPVLYYPLETSSLIGLAVPDA